MSALSVGGSAVRRAEHAADGNGRADEKPTPGVERTAVGRFVKWIPGDAVAFYTALLALDGPTDRQPATRLEQLRDIDQGSGWWFFFALAVAVLLVLTGAVNERRHLESGTALNKLGRSLTVRCLLTVIAFVLWASLLPTSWPSSWHVVQDMGAAYVLVLGVLATLFAWMAERVTGSARLS
jgi:hypothetical protein